jgi:2-polyprenyl-6-methoxyphenol hydroxylase-like FAD-dependent oxidoreductase
MNDSYDALVIGGGPGGATAALLLARAGWSVALVERKTFPRRKVCGEYLSATSLPLLEHLGVAEVFRDRAGPPVSRVGLFAGSAMLSADLPRPGGRNAEWGRALAREHLDSLLLDQARRSGVKICQPCAAMALRRTGQGYECLLKSLSSQDVFQLHANIIVAAHGSWETGSLPTQPARLGPRPSDLFGFKAHFRNSDLAAGLMPLLAFPGGYGGMVHCDGGRVSLSCCVGRDVLSRIRDRGRGDAGETVLGHILEACKGARLALDGATREGAWLSAGPIRPGIRLHAPTGIFPVGNAAGEAHPVVAEGISMAMQSAWLLAQRLIARRRTSRLPNLGQVMTDYAAAWRRHFAARLYASAVVAQWAMWPAAVASTLPLMRTFQSMLTWGARLSGKAKRTNIAY